MGWTGGTGSEQTGTWSDGDASGTRWVWVPGGMVVTPDAAAVQSGNIVAP